MELEGRIPEACEVVSKDEAGKIKPKQPAKDLRSLHLTGRHCHVQFAVLSPDEIEKRLLQRPKAKEIP